MDKKIESLLKQLYKENQLNKEQLKYILDNITNNTADLLLSYVNQCLLKTYQNKVYLRALVEFSNYCKNNCYYCGIRKNNHRVSRYRLLPEQIIDCCKSAYQQGYRTFVLQSGEDNYYSIDLLISTIRKIKTSFPEIAITLSIGELSKESYLNLYQAGANRFLLRHETISPELYKKYHPEISYQKRIQALKDLKEIGYQVGAGFIVGLPGQTNRLLAEELLFLKELNPEMVGIGPFIPHPKTPLANSQTGSVEKTLILLALIRLLLPEVLLPITTAVNTLDKKGWEKGLKAGANVIMPIISPLSTRGKYEIYKNKGNTDATELAKIKKRVEKAGFQVDLSRGDNPIWLKKQMQL